MRDSKHFHAILKELGRLHDQKQLDYGTDSDPFANIRGSEEWGIAPWIGALVRATDKLRRLQKYVRVGWLANEAVEDSFRDLAVYAIIGLVLYEESPDATARLPDDPYGDDPDKGDGLREGDPSTDLWYASLNYIFTPQVSLEVNQNE